MFLESIKELIRVKYSEKGSCFRRKEEQAYIFFVDFLDECIGEFLLCDVFTVC